MASTSATYTTGYPRKNVTSEHLDEIAGRSYRLVGLGAKTALRETLFQCLALCPDVEIKQKVNSSYDAGVAAYKRGNGIKDIDGLKGYDKISWQNGWENAAIAASAVIRAMAN